MMNAAKLKKHKKLKSKKLVKLINDSDSGSESEHELSYYQNDRIKLMKEVIKILKPKKIKSIAPKCMKDLDINEMNSLLLEELLGISNKRLKYILNGQPHDDESSSTDEEKEVISLDDITDDDFVIDLDSDNDEHKKKSIHKRIKEEPKEIIKKEDQNKSKRQRTGDIIDDASKEHLMSVLELLELQARARAIRSQLALENNKKNQEKEKKEKVESSSDIEEAIIIESPVYDEILITSSDSENDHLPSDQPSCSKTHHTNKQKHMRSLSSSKNADASSSNIEVHLENSEEVNKLLNKIHKIKKQKQKLFKNGMRNSESKQLKENIQKESESVKNGTESEQSKNENKSETNKESKTAAAALNKEKDDQNSKDSDEIVLNVDQAELDSVCFDAVKSTNIVSQPQIHSNVLIRKASIAEGEKNEADNFEEDDITLNVEQSEVDLLELETVE